jgi:hypothetical protein
MSKSLPKPERISPVTEKAGGGPVPVSQITRLTVSLYQPDLERIDAIKDFMKARGFRNLKDSEALRLACRAVEIDDHFVSVYQAMQREDGRRRPEIAKAG